MSELLVERERLVMEAEDLRSFVAGRHFMHNLFNRQGLPPSHLPRTWQRAYEPLFSDWLNRHDVIHEALRDLRMGDPESAERLLKHEVGEFRRTRRMMSTCGNTPHNRTEQSHRAATVKKNLNRECMCFHRTLACHLLRPFYCSKVRAGRLPFGNL